MNTTSGIHEISYIKHLGNHALWNLGGSNVVAYFSLILPDTLIFALVLNMPRSFLTNTGPMTIALLKRTGKLGADSIYLLRFWAHTVA